MPGTEDNLSNYQKILLVFNGILFTILNAGGAASVRLWVAFPAAMSSPA
jgi:hypothetical protein